MKITINELRQLVKQIIFESVEQFDIEQKEIKDELDRVFPQYKKVFEKERSRAMRLIGSGQLKEAKKYILDTEYSRTYIDKINDVTEDIAKTFASSIPTQKKFIDMMLNIHDVKIISKNQLEMNFRREFPKMVDNFLKSNLNSGLIRDILKYDYPLAAEIINKNIYRKYGFKYFK